MRRDITEEELVRDFDNALSEHQIYMCYQPQYNHSTGRVVGAEALMRWQHPLYGMQSPGVFIPLMEKLDLVHGVDLYAFEEICRFLRKCIDDKVHLLPISFNISRHDIFGHDYVKEIEEIRKKYDIPVKYLRAEITESSAIGGIELILSVIGQLHDCGYIVELDDFGSGYSSLSILKSLLVDVIKLDLRFFAGDGLSGRSGIIINSVIQMARWLNVETIAEGIEKLEQADFLKGIGCNYIQGYLYSRPIPEADLLKLMQKTEYEPMVPSMTLIHTMNAERFWDPDSLETLIFNNYVGAAAIFSYKNGKVDIMRVNPKYVKELGMNLTEHEIIRSNPWDNHSAESREIYENTIKKAIETGEEEVCETWRVIRSKCCGDDSICIRSHIRMIGRAGDQAIIYAIIQNVTAEKKRYQELYEGDKLLRFASDHANVYAWEYSFDTKDMRPCFRCMRDLGLPAVLHNYPEPVIEMGLFPQDYADMYRDWHKQLEAGVEHLEAIIPLTAGRIPFHVRYTNEFDENGRPLKAYGSATLVVDGEDK